MTARTMLKVKAPVVDEVAAALAGWDGRRVEIMPCDCRCSEPIPGH
jgi:hypothetical protein